MNDPPDALRIPFIDHLGGGNCRCFVILLFCGEAVVIRWLQKQDGTRVLQWNRASFGPNDWVDVPTEVGSAMRHTGNEECPICRGIIVPTGQSYAACYGRKVADKKPKPRKPREWWVIESQNGLTIHESPPPMSNSFQLFKVREVLE